MEIADEAGAGADGDADGLVGGDGETGADGEAEAAGEPDGEAEGDGDADSDALVAGSGLAGAGVTTTPGGPTRVTAMALSALTPTSLIVVTPSLKIRTSSGALLPAG
jgi:hypothetical protein